MFNKYFYKEIKIIRDSDTLYNFSWKWNNLSVKYITIIYITINRIQIKENVNNKILKYYNLSRSSLIEIYEINYKV